MTSLLTLQNLFNEKKYSEIIKTVKNNHSSEALMIKAYSFQKLAKWDDAMQIWNMLIVQNDQEPYYFIERGVCKFNLRFKHAIEDFDQAIKLDDTSAYFYSCRAYVRDKIGNPEGAVDDYTKAHELDPEDALILNNLGLVEQKLGYTQKARKSFDLSNDILGFKERTADDVKLDTLKKDEVKNTPSKFSFYFKEIKQMLSSKEEFKKFLKEAFRG